MNDDIDVLVTVNEIMLETALDAIDTLKKKGEDAAWEAIKTGVWRIAPFLTFAEGMNPHVGFMHSTRCLRIAIALSLFLSKTPSPDTSKMRSDIKPFIALIKNGLPRTAAPSHFLEIVRLHDDLSSCMENQNLAMLDDGMLFGADDKELDEIVDEMPNMLSITIGISKLNRGEIKDLDKKLSRILGL